MHRLIYIFFLFLFVSANAQQTEVRYLSGKGSDDMVQWEFYCTGGMNANKWTTIGVPSCWELQGFGKYNYGFAKDSAKGKEQGLYKHRFTVPADWKGKTVNIVFEGVMTDADVKVNGKPAGPMHQGAFYAFRYDISKFLKYGAENLLEVTVAKHSANRSVNAAEREGDFWIFGGIFRPVWLEALPQPHISQVFIDAGADGLFTALINTNASKKERMEFTIYNSKGDSIAGFGAPNASDMRKGAFVAYWQVNNIKAWTPETPELYTAVFTLYKNNQPVHRVSQKIGFRTVELRKRDGIYVNGVKVKFKGINRHSFRPETGRTLSKQNSIEDVLLIKEMNMNAVRMSHYPPDAHFLDVCDSLGLFVMDELAGWHGHYDTPTGKKLLKEMIDHDSNHPSVVLWSNGNEGGHNVDLDSLFREFDLQERPVVHPWQLFNGIETQHYRQYNYGIGNYDNGHDIVLPTEFLHGQYDGGHGAGLEDYWDKMWRDPLHAGGFLWDFADQAVVRKDLNDSLDTDKHRGADGIVGPHHEKEGSFYAVKQIWSPVYFERREMTPDFDGRLTIENRYLYTNLDQCSFSWELKRFGLTTLTNKKGGAVAPSIAPGAKGVLELKLPEDWNTCDALYVRVKDRNQMELFTWSFPISLPGKKAAEIVKKEGAGAVQINTVDSLYQIRVKELQISINKNTGLLVSVKNGNRSIPLTNGPRIQEGVTNFKKFSHRFEGKNLIIASAFDKKESFNTLQWTIYPSGWVRMEVHYFPLALHTNMLGVNFDYPESQMRSVTYMGNGPYRVWKNRMKGTAFGVWDKQYNSTETGEQWVYPEFKGYYSNFYGGYFNGADQRFVVATETEDLFLRLFSAAPKTDPWHNYEPLFPDGAISFMQGIPAIGNKTQTSETTGPMGQKNIFYDYEKDPGRALKMVLYFDFSSNPEAK
ncbi:glycoside hydrolase family 2 [Niabella pedocola]|uniref:beta-galactosidase n=1 Tax=Niabella pedocola TaxID=1752077 RepID=A0ABS8PT30_9BACT|nr:glycoside hydrolase family 2 TIM barrel-domain containing protein [Niabella pedocola]MCD2423066.1 glycoside hydrolase family 2 [Niabella pedocola]